jgi:hypothetical protein
MSAIQNEQAKEFLLKAEDLMKQEKYPEAISYATAGLDIMFTRANEFFSIDGVQYSEADRRKGLDETTICYGLGINIEQYVRYRKMAGYFGPLGGGLVSKKPGIFSCVKFNYDKKDAEVSLDYCTQTIINMEETLERLKKPLSEE